MDLKTIITPRNVREQLAKLPELKTPVMDDIYPASVRDTYPFDAIRIHEVQAVTKAVPVVSRGSASVSLNADEGTETLIEPLPVVVNQTVTAAELNRLKTAGSGAQGVWLRNKIDFARRTIRATTEALCAQSLSGKITFAMKSESGMATYSINYGNVLKIQSGFNFQDAKLGAIYEALDQMAAKIEENGGGSQVEFKAGTKVFAKILDVASQANSGAIKVELKDDGIIIGGYKIKRYNSKYYHPKDKAYKPVIEDTKLKAVAKDGGFAFRYLAIDDVEAGLQALPIWIKTAKLDDPSGYKIIANSKPLPIPSIRSICDTNITV